MYVCTLFGALFCAPITIRRADRYSARWVVWMCLKLNMHYEYTCMYIDVWTRREYWAYHICMYACMYTCIMYVCYRLARCGLAVPRDMRGGAGRSHAYFCGAVRLRAYDIDCGAGADPALSITAGLCGHV